VNWDKKRRCLDEACEIQVDRLAKMKAPDLRVYTLGMVGEEMVKQIWGINMNANVTKNQVAHDVASAEVVLALFEKVGEFYELAWGSRVEASLLTKNGSAIIEPDGVVYLNGKKGGKRKGQLLIEYHNEWRRERAPKKVRKYHKVFNEGIWPQVYGEFFPPVFVVFRRGIVGKAYREEINKIGNRLKVKFFGKHWDEILEREKIDLWWDLKSTQKVSITEAIELAREHAPAGNAY
jgi:hypothetical protein